MMESPQLTPVSASDGRPLHVQVRNALSASLATGVWKAGDQLPTEAELSRQLGVSEGTVRQAILALVKESRLTRRSGKGTFVSRLRFDESFTRFFRFKSKESSGEPVLSVTVRAARIERAPHPDVRRILGVGAGVPLVVLHRIISADDVVVCHYTSHLSAQRFPGLQSLPLDGVGLYDVLESRYGIHVVRASETLQARAARRDDKRILGVPETAPVIAIERIAYTYHDEVVEVRNTVGRSDTFRYEIQLGQRIGR
jgi:GntR family transcriptional regulator